MKRQLLSPPFLLGVLLVLVGSAYLLSQPSPSDQPSALPPPVAAGSAATPGMAPTAAAPAAALSIMAAAAPVVGPQALPQALFALQDEVEGARLRIEDLNVEGRSAKLAGMPDFATIAEGSTLRIVLVGGQELTAHVNYSRPDAGAPGVRALAAGFPDKNGGLSLYQNRAKGTVAGRIWLMDQEIAYVVQTRADGSVWETERWKASLLCASAPMPEPLPKGMAAAAPPVPAAPEVPPALSSRATATAVLYLDFDGEPNTVYPDWPASNPGGVIFSCAAAPLTAAQMTEVWRIVSEDYAPFDIDVTTLASRYTGAPVGSRMRIIITGTDAVGAGAGVAWLNSFAQAGISRASNVPCWMPASAYVANVNVPTANAHRIMASATSHELGHTLGLSHDGTFAQGPAGNSNYFGGHGTPPNDWSPIMGNYWGVNNTGRAVVQWSKGEYTDANNFEDDVAIIANATNGFGYVPDVSTGLGDATPLAVAGTDVTGAGLTEKASDVDYFSVPVPAAGPISFTVSPYSGQVMTPDLSAYLEILNAGGSPVAAASAVDVAPVTVSFNAPAAGTYYLTVRGTGQRNVQTTGYSAYGSLGSYVITGTIPPVPDTIPPTVTIGTPVHNSVISAITSISGTAADAGGSGIAGNSVNLTLFQVSSGKYWDGSGWVASPASLSVPVIGTGWTYAGTLPDNSGNSLGGQYALSAATHDNSGNPSQSQTGVNSILFTVDTNPPAVAITSPANGSVITTASYVLAGTANDASGILQVNCFVRRNSDSYYWNGSGWGAPPINLVTHYDATAAQWNCIDSLPQPGFGLANGGYNFIAIAYDNAGNTTQTNSVVTVDYHPIYTWTGATFRDADPNNDSHSWGTPENWFPYGVPDAGDIAVIDNGDQVDSSISRNVSGLRLINGVLNFTNGPGSLGTLTSTGNSTWASGRIGGNWNNQAGATIYLTGGAVKYLAGNTVLNNAGTITWAGGGYLSDNGGNCTINNLAGGTYNAAADGSPFEDYNGGNTFNNMGTFVRSAGTDPMSIHSWAFNNTGTIRCDSSVLRFDGILNLNAGTALAGTAFIYFNGSVHANAPLTVPPTVRLVGGTLFCPAGAAFDGSTEWTGGMINGTLNIPAGAVFNISGGAVKYLAGNSVLNNSGTITWTGGYVSDNGGNCTINNLAGGTYNATADGSPLEDYNGGNVFNNEGTFVRSGGIDPMSIHSWTFNNTGIIRCVAGILRFDGLLNMNAGTSFTGTAPIHLNGSVHANAPVTIPATVSLVGGTLFCPVGAALSGAMAWTGGLINGTLNIPAGAILNITGGSVKYLAGNTVLNNAGTINWAGGYVSDNGGNCTINNLAGGTYNATMNGSPLEDYNGGNVFNNAGTFVRSGGTDPMSIHSWTFNNTGIIRCETGVLQFDGLLNMNTGTSFTGPAPIYFNGAVHANAPVNIPATVRLVGGTLFCPVGAALNGSTEWSGGMIDGTLTIPAGAILNITGGTNKVLAGGTVLNNAGTINWMGGSNGYLRDNGGNCTINNLAGGTYNAAVDGSPFEDYNGGNVFNNTGTFVRSGGVAPMSIHSWTFNNTGIIRSLAGVLQFDGLLNMNAGTSFTGTAPIYFNGTVYANAPVTIPATVNLVGGTLFCPVGAALSGAMEWSGGIISGTLNIPAGATLNITGGSVKYLAGNTVLNNAGTINWTGGVNGYLRDSGGNCAINNLTGGTFNVAADGSPFEDYNGGNVFTNAGNFIKSAGVGTANVHSWTFKNTYKIIANSGAIIFDGGELDLNAGGLVMGLAEVHFSGGTTVLRGITTCLGGHGIFDGATLTGHADGTGTLAGGRWDWAAGTSSGLIKVAASSSLFLTGAGNRDMYYNAVIENSGTINFEGSGSLRGLGGSVLHNKAGATFNAAGSANFTDYSNGNSFINDGSVVIGAPLSQWTMAWGFTQSAGGSLHVEVGGPSLGEFDRLVIGATATLAGTVNVTRRNGYAPAVGTTFEFLTAGSVSGTFTAVTGGFAADYTAATATLRAIPTPINFSEWKNYYFGNTSSAWDLAVPYGDGVTNLMKYALSMEPGMASVAGLPIAQRAGGHLTLAFSRKSPSDVTYIVAASDGLGTWVPIAQLAAGTDTWTGTGAVAEPSSGGIRSVTVTDPEATAAHAKRFLHLQITLP